MDDGLNNRNLLWHERTESGLHAIIMRIELEKIKDKIIPWVSCFIIHG